ncbi:MAG TPA: Stp1/IreP family PP2C-type Ser/Thr phosphatase [Ktedonobacteraceae bacterium]|nr:Stp1/IreP family PP2C-type Ser/Thr phosphatase [Ktedonobacteraceae bacterium]
MAKLLRLDVAQLTDVGRKREHNEDNMAYVIPKDPQVMARKGALFIVADGMGGHAAGEVASEIAVDTVSNAYYQDENDDVPTSLLQSIRRDNGAIHQRAAENMLRSGMGTTCVSAVLRGGVAYIANVGDSRAYFVRKSRIYQISQDHSWVAEQVRAGLLTEEQARTHAQRNVITRSLGTQPDVEIDIFREVLEEGDTLVLCSDGLSGLVNDEDLLRTVDQFVPQESVYHLVERANENGGPDNITAIVVRVQEVGVEPANARQPVPVGGPELSNEDTARLFAPSSAGFNLSTRNGDMPVPGSPFPYNSAPLASADSDTAPHPALQARKRRGRLFYPSLIMLVLFVLLAGALGGYYLLHTNQSQTINQTLADANTLINQASRETSQNPAQALRDLASAQQKLQDLSRNYSENGSQFTSLQNQLVSNTKAAIQQYNQAGLITLLPCTNATPTNDLNTNTANSLSVINANTTHTTYTLGQDGQIYQLVQSSSSNNTNQYTLTSAFAPANTKITGMVGIKQQVLALSQATNNGTADTYAINLLSPGQHGVLQSVKAETIDAAQMPGGQTPTLITAGNDGTNIVIYVVLASPSNRSSATVLAYTVSTDGKNTFSGPTTSSISVTEPIISLAATNKQLFLLQADGSVWSSPILTGHKISLVAAVQVDQSIAAPLTASPQGFTASTSVPIPTPTAQKGSVPLTVPLSQNNPATLTVSGANTASQYHLFISDPANHRVLDLTPLASAGGPTPTTTTTSQGASLPLTLVQQYASPAYFNTIKGVAIDPSGTTMSILGQRTPSSEDLVVISTDPTKVCAA